MNPASESKGELLEIDGSLLEGGGQVLRNSTTLAALLGRAIRIVKIRAGRDRPGLRMQHLTGMNLVAEIVNGKLTNAKVKSVDVSFEPGPPTAREHYEFEADAVTAGSVGLMIQAAFPCLVFLKAPTKVILKGGTNGIKAPLIDYTQLIFTPIVKRLTALNFGFSLVRRGFFPKGGGIVEMHTRPIKSHIPSFKLVERGDVVCIKGVSSVSGRLPIKIAARMHDSAMAVLKKHYPNIPIEVEIRKEEREVSPSNGVFIFLYAKTTTDCLLASSRLGERGVPAEQIGAQCANTMVEELSHGGCVDEYMQDQLILFMALAKGRSELLAGPLSLHTRTAIHWATTLTGAKFNVSKVDQDTKAVLISCDGVGYTSRFR